jgi:hypothetical protein
MHVLGTRLDSNLVLHPSNQKTERDLGSAVYLRFLK